MIELNLLLSFIYNLFIYIVYDIYKKMVTLTTSSYTYSSLFIYKKYYINKIYLGVCVYKILRMYIL